MQIAVLGMHRSGTSALTRLLGLIGCHLGDAADFNPVRPDNPAGDWERSDVWALNEDALAALDATWCRIAGFDTERILPATRAAFEVRARAILARLDPRRPWAIKDPRMCLTFPIWRPALVTPVCVLIHRDPLAVARSLARRDGFPLAVGLALWEAHALGALEHSRGLPRALATHAALMQDPVAAIRILRRELESAGVRGLSSPDEAAVRAFIDPSLQHARGDDDERSVALNPSQRRLATALDDGSALAWNDVPAWSASARDLVLGYFRLQQERDGVAADRDRVALQFQHKAEEVVRLAEAHRQAEALARQSDALARRCDALEQANANLEQTNAALDQANAALEQANAALTQRTEELAQRNADVVRLGATDAAAARAGLDRLEQRLRRVESDLDVVMGQGDELERLIELILSSRRFRFGDEAGAILSKALLRPAQPRAAEHARRVVAAFRRACDKVKRRRAGSTGD